MAIDYSKWDKLELSDDSDIEVHPNVDKNSFVRWKQRDIHEKREQRNQEIKSILVQLTMYSKLNARVDFILKEFKPSELGDVEKVMARLDTEFDKTERFDYEALISQKGDTLRKGLKDLKFEKEEIENTPPYNEMIEDLFIQVKEDHPDAEDPIKLAQYLKDHRQKIDDLLSNQTIKLDDLLYQKSLLISSDDYHTGFDRSFLNKDKEEPEPQPKPSTTKTVKSDTVTTVETINTPTSLSSAAVEEKSEADMLDELELSEETKQFSKIPLDDHMKASEFLMKHWWICTEQQKDALIMTAFDHQLQGDSIACRNVVHQSLLLQYIGQLSGGEKGTKETRLKAIKLFLTRISQPGPAKAGFLQDVENTFKHIVNRCEIIKQEQQQEASEEGEALIQLRALDDDTQLSVSIPPEGTEEYEIFSTQVPKELQDAVKTQSLDEVNKVFATYKIEEAEAILELINQCGVIGVTDYLEDEQQFQDLKHQYESQEIHEENQTSSTEHNDSSKLTADIVD